MNRLVLPVRPPRSRRGATLTPLARQGATLTEVLMSLLIMGLGITSVFTLFPMSILRSVKSTNLTHAALLAETAREFYVYQKAVLTLPPAQSTFNYYSHAKDFFLADATNPIPDTQIPEPFVGTFVVDPLGGVNANAYGLLPGQFGNPVNPVITPGAPGGVLRVANQSPAPMTYAGVFDELYTSLDSWITAYEDIPVSLANNTVAGTNVTEITFLPQTDLTGTITTGTAGSVRGSRVLAVSTDNRQSSSLNVHGTAPLPSGNILRLSTTLPTSLFDPGAGVNNVGLIRVQNFERRYSFLLTMHRDELGETRGQVVVFFRREYGDSENTFALDPNTAADRTIINKRLRTVRVNLGAAFTGRSPSPGDYIFGTWLAKPGNPVVHGRWYRIVAVSELGANYYQLTLDRAWEGLTDAGNDPRIMLPGGVISVFDL